MFALIEAALAIVGVLAIIVVYVLYCDGAFDERPPPPPDPYREGLDASARISSLAWEAEQAMYRAAEQATREERR
jgi:hypothetical protein